MAPPAPAAPAARYARLHAFELLIFATLFVLLGLCLAAAPLLAPPAEKGGPLRPDEHQP